MENNKIVDIFIKRQKRYDDIFENFQKFIVENNISKEELDYLITTWFNVIKKENDKNEN